MRILITTDIFPPDSGGPATYVPKIAGALVAQGDTVEVLTYSSTPPAPELIAQDAALPYLVARIYLNRGRVRRLLHTWRCLLRALARADIVYVNGLLIETALVNLFLRRPAVAKVVGDITWERAQDRGWTRDDFAEFQAQRYRWQIELRRALRNWALRQMRRVIVPSQYLQQTVIGWGILPAQTCVIYNGHAVAAPTGDGVTLPLPASRNLITVGRLIPLKGIDGIIRLLPQLPDVGLVVVGDGPEQGTLTALTVHCGVADRVLFTGRLAHTGVQAYLRACDLFVLNSRHEGLPHVVLEALAAGLPVVATAAGGTPEVVDDGINGALVPLDDPAALRAAVVQWLDAGLRDAITLPEQFTEKSMLQRTVDVLHAVPRREEVA